jgi:hypothetical protein
MVGQSSPDGTIPEAQEDPKKILTVQNQGEYTSALWNRYHHFVVPIPLSGGAAWATALTLSMSAITVCTKN